MARGGGETLAQRWLPTLQTYLHLAAWAQIGALVRIYLGQVFGGACYSNPTSTTAWLNCVVSKGTHAGGVAFKDLPANIAGSFLMGLLVSSDVLGAHTKTALAREAPIAALPRSSGLQAHAPLLVGLRTGLCGSLTTFASWVTQMVQMLVGGAPMAPSSFTQWFTALCGLLLGVLCAMASLVAGQHAALALYARWNPGATAPFVSAAAGAGAAALKPGVEAPAPSPVAARAASGCGAPVSSVVVVEREASGVAAATGADGVAAVEPGALELERSATVVSIVEEDGADGVVVDGDGKGAAGSTAAATAVSTVTTAAPTRLPYPAAALASDLFALASLALLTGVSLWLVSTRQPAGAWSAPGFWFTLLFAPVGCFWRFWLARFNGALPGSLSWFPAGTFAANQAACCIDFFLLAIQTRVALDPLQSNIVFGITVGVSGCLSTVSTWVVEIQKLLLPFPAHARGYTYCFASLATALALGVAIYGGPVWSAPSYPY